MPLSYLIYHSRALLPPDPGFHNDILEACQRNNARLGVTGFLHREEDFFVQYLEGEAEALEAILPRIKSDPRHSNFTAVAEGALVLRRLPDWQMGFVDGDQLSLVELVGVEDGQIRIKSADPMELVDFVVSNADRLCGAVMAA